MRDTEQFVEYVRQLLAFEGREFIDAGVRERSNGQETLYVIKAREEPEFSPELKGLIEDAARSCGLPVLFGSALPKEMRMTSG